MENTPECQPSKEGSIHTQVPGNRVNIYICKRPWENSHIKDGFCSIVKYLIENDEVEYHLYLENLLKSHDGVLTYHDNSRCHFFDRMIEVEEKIDYAITIGGDGTVLWAHKVFGELDLPLFLCFNGGSVCFLSVFDLHQVKETMEYFHNRVKDKKAFRIKEFSRLHSNVCNPETCDLVKKFALNDIVVERSTPSMVILDLYLNDCFAIQIRADGLLISSSTGSTAYNLSLANGIIMHSDLDCVIINPMAPMSLSSRPLVVPSNAKVKIVCSLESRADARLVYDGMDALKFSKGYNVIIESAPTKARLIIPEEHKDYEAWIMKLRELRGWK